MTGIVQIEALGTTLAWMAAYCVHSSVLLAVAWLAGRLLGERRIAIQEALWRVALIGGLVTATLQMATGLQPIAGDFRLLDLNHRSDAASTRPSAVEGGRTETAVPAFGGGSGSVSVAKGEMTATSRTGSGIPWKWSALLVLGWIAGAVFAVLGVARARIRLGRLVHSGRTMPPGRLIRRLAKAMGVRRPVEVRVSSAFDAPFATGVFKPRICVPDFTVRELAPAEVENLMAHEMAHLARHDPAWILLSRLLEGVLFFQPLNRIARRRLEALAECLCDARAISCTGKPLDLARCLLQVAEQRTHTRPVLAAAAVGSRSRLAHRIERLLQPPTETARCGPWITVGLALGLLGAAAVLPAISASAVDQSQPASWTGGFSGDLPHLETPAPPDEPESAKPTETVENVAPPAEPAAPAPPDPVSEPAADSLAAAERLEMLSQLEAEIAGSDARQWNEQARIEAEREAALAAAAEAATRNIEAHVAALEAQTLDLEQAKEAIRDEMNVLKRQLRELNREREVSREEIERSRAEARRLAEERRPSREEIDRLRAEQYEQQRQLEALRGEERSRALDERRSELEAIRRSVLEAVRQDIEERRQAEEAARQRAEMERQERERSEQHDGD